MVNCDEIDPLLVDYWEGNLSRAQEEKIDAHIQTCPSCRQIREEYKLLFDLMSNEPLQQPSPLMHHRFGEMLGAEEKIAASSAATGDAKTMTSPSISFPTWMRVAASIVLVAGGILIGTRIVPRENGNTAQIAALNQQVKEVKEVLMVTLLNNESASERLKAVNYAEEMNQPDPKVIQALIHTINTDNNVNVRLAALYSLDKFASSQQVRDSLVASLPRQKEPVMQIVLINILAEQKEAKAIDPIRKILSDKKSLQPVREVAQKGLRAI